jgi:hypothetical protein
MQPLMRLLFVLIACLGLSVVAMRGEAEGFCGGLGCSPAVHQKMTAEVLAFIKGSTLSDINDEHEFQEIFGVLDPDEHFDSCSFSGAAAEINANYRDALKQANPNDFDSGDLADQFGQVLHAIQDFYSHSNWVELGQTALIDRGTGFWSSLTPYSLHDGVLLVQGEDGTPFGRDSSLKRSAKVVFVNTGSSPPVGLPPGTYKGVISGTFGIVDDCPDNVSLSHGALNKDTPNRPGFEDARKLAVEQTEHEWCRLVNLVRQRYGQKGVDVLFNKWVIIDEVLRGRTITGQQVFKAGSSITAGPDLIIGAGANVKFIAGDIIRLKPGFAAQQGSRFQAKVESIPCNSGFPR